VPLQRSHFPCCKWPPGRGSWCSTVANSGFPPEFRAIQSINDAHAWVTARGGDLPRYLACMEVARRLDAVRQHAAKLLELDAKLAPLRSKFPEFTITVSSPPGTSFDAPAAALSIAGVSSRDQASDPVIHRMLERFLERAAKHQCEEPIALTWKRPGRRAHRTKVGEEPLMLELVALALVDGVARVLRLQPLRRRDLPILAVAAEIDQPSKHNGVALRKEFERREGRWRKKAAPAEKRLRGLALGLELDDPESFVAKLNRLVK